MAEMMRRWEPPPRYRRPNRYHSPILTLEETIRRLEEEAMNEKMSSGNSEMEEGDTAAADIKEDEDEDEDRLQCGGAVMEVVEAPEVAVEARGIAMDQQPAVPSSAHEDETAQPSCSGTKAKDLTPQETKPFKEKPKPCYVYPFEDSTSVIASDFSDDDVIGTNIFMEISELRRVEGASSPSTLSDDSNAAPPPSVFTYLPQIRTLNLAAQFRSPSPSACIDVILPLPRAEALERTVQG
ncbi:unnamed protein product [Heligmosomoides polygyrus]|uniref:Uncharacterized protein n=1 Tax=Heligmosomoides polygyrus TaxID=6339 RepID=A0A183GC32_HELPZ|nr:unnamed protein product [Heligmosomoides polygyrus]